MKLVNETHIEGILYNHNLTLKTAGDNSKNPGVQFINGTIDIATDDELTNIIQIHYTYETPTFAKSGQTNSRYNTLLDILNGVTKCYMKDGDAAARIRVDSTIALNEFYSNRSGQEELVSVKRNEGGFIHLNPTLKTDVNERSSFKCDMVITGARRIEADETRNTEEKVILKGYIFDFRGTPMPVEFNVYRQDAMDYFENAEPSEKDPLFTKVQGYQVTQTVVTKITEESAFGTPYVREVTNSRKEYVVNWAAKEPFIWNDESTMTVAQFQKGLADRELALAEMKKRSDEYQASRQATNAPSAFATPAPAAPTNTGRGFNF